MKIKENVTFLNDNTFPSLLGLSFIPSQKKSNNVDEIKLWVNYFFVANTVFFHCVLGGISDNDIKTFVTATTVSFNWSMMVEEFSVSLFLNGTSQIIKSQSGFFVWRNLTPATIYTFTFIFEQLNPEFVNVTQSLDIQAETGIYQSFL